MHIDIPFHYFQIEFNDNYYLVQSLNDTDFFGLVESPDEWGAHYKSEIEKFLNKPTNYPILSGEFIDYTQLEIKVYSFSPKAFPEIRVNLPYIHGLIRENKQILLKVPQYGLEFLAKNETEISFWLSQKLEVYINNKVKKNKRHIFYLLNHPNIELGVSKLNINLKGDLERAYLEEAQKYFNPLPKEMEDIYEQDAVLKEIDSALNNHHLGSILIQGTAGSGKSLALRQALKRWGANNTDYAIFTVSASNFIKRLQKFHFAWQTGIIEIGQKLNSKPVIIHIQDIYSFFNIGKYENYNISVGAFLAPYIQRGDLRIITEITEKERSHIEAVNPNYLSYFQQIKMPHLSDEKLESVLHKSIERLNRKEDLQISPSVSQTAVRLGQRFFPYAGSPKMPVKIIQNALFYFQSKTSSDFNNNTLGPKEVLEAFCYQNQINPSVLNPDLNNSEQVNTFFESRLFGQPKAIEFVLDITRLIKTDLARPGKPISNLLFVGSSGVGKTQLAKLLSGYLFVKKEQFIRFDMSEYSNIGDAQRLLRSDDSGRFTLVSAIKRYPFSLLLFDEIEKAHEDVFDLLLQILGAGRLTDDKGETINFCSSLIIMTSNLGSENLFRNYINIGGKNDDKHFEQNLIAQVTKHFRPEFINRIDAIIPFKPLDKKVTKDIVEKEIKDLQERMGFDEDKLKLHPTPAVIDHLAELGFNKEFGARHIQRTIRDQLLIPLSTALLDYSKKYAYDIIIQYKKEKLDFNIKKQEAKRQRFETVQQLGDLANDLYRMFVQHFEVSITKDYIDLVNSIEQENLDALNVERNILQEQMSSLKDQLDFFEYQLNRETISKFPDAMTIEAMMLSWEEQFISLKKQLLSLMHPEMNQQFVYILGGNSSYLCQFYIQLADLLQLDYKLNGLRKSGQNSLSRHPIKLTGLRVEAVEAKLAKEDDQTVFELHLTGPLVKILLAKEGGYQSVSISSKSTDTSRILIEDQPVMDDNTILSLLSLRANKIRRKISKRKWEDLIYKQQRNKGVNTLLQFLSEQLHEQLDIAVEDHYIEEIRKSKLN